MLTKTRQILNLSQDVSKEILSDIVRKNAAEFSDKFFHLQYAIQEMFKGVLKVTFKSTPTLLQCTEKRLPSILCN